MGATPMIWNEVDLVHLACEDEEGVDFTKYALLAIIQYVQWSKIG